MSLLHAYLAFVTRHVRKVLGGTHLTRPEEIMRDVRADFEVQLEEFNGESNHLHLLVNFPPKVASPGSSTRSRACPRAG